MMVIEVTYRETAAAPEGAAADLRLLSADEQRRHDRFAFAEDRRDYAAAHALLRRRLSAAVPIPPESWAFEAAPDGKPRLSTACRLDAPLSFNLSHTRGLVACAVAPGVDVGIDVESVRASRDWTSIASHYFAPVESDWVTQAPSDDQPSRFIALWTLKEAWLKAVGTGLYGTLNGFSFSFGTEATIEFHPPEGVDAGDWRFALFEPAAGYRLAIAVRAPSWQPGPRVIARSDAPGGASPILLRSWRLQI